MKKRLLLGVMLASICVGCGAESTPTEPSETATTTEEITPEPTEEPLPEPEPQAAYTYSDMSATMYAQQTVNVRDLPDTSGNKIGSLSTNDEIKISGQCLETGWYRFDYNGSTAYVSNSYLNNEKVEVSTQASNNSTLESCPYEFLKLYDDGGKEITFYYLDDGTYNSTAQALVPKARSILQDRGYTQQYTDENGHVWTTACCAFEYIEHQYAEGKVTQCNVFYGQFLNSSTGLPTFHGEGVMIPTRY